MSALARIVRGLGTLPGYGPHPGVPVVALLIATGTLATAIDGGWVGAVVGAFGMAAWSVPLLLYGAWDRARDAERHTQGDAQ